MTALPGGVVGEWRGASSEENLYLKIYDDGKFRATGLKEGTWKVDGNILTLSQKTTAYSMGINLGPNEKKYDTYFYRINGNRLIIDESSHPYYFASEYVKES